MSMTQTLAEQQHEVETFRGELAQVQEALARADSYLEKTDEALIGATAVAEQTRRLAPAIGIAIAATAAVVITVAILRRRRRGRLPS